MPWSELLRRACEASARRRAEAPRDPDEEPLSLRPAELRQRGVGYEPGTKASASGQLAEVLLYGPKEEPAGGH